MNIETYEVAVSVIDRINADLKRQAGINRMGKKVHKLRKAEEDKVFTMICSHAAAIHSIEVVWSQLAHHYFYLVINFKEHLDNVLTNFVHLEVDE